MDARPFGDHPSDMELLPGEVEVTVTHEDHHQQVLARYPAGFDEPHRVLVQLGWCTVRSGKHRGQGAIEVRIGGERVGELTHLMSMRYAPMVDQILARRGRPGCAGQVFRSERGLEVRLFLPRAYQDVVPIAGPTPAAISTSSKKPLLIGSAVVGLVLLLGAVVGGSGDDSTAAPGEESASSAVVATSTTATSSSVAAPVAPPAAPVTSVEPAPAPAPVPPPVTTAKLAKPKASAPVPQPEPVSTCDPNYSGCVPIASDVDCQGGKGNGPAYVRGPVDVIGSDIYDLDADNDGTGCE